MVDRVINIVSLIVTTLGTGLAIYSISMAKSTPPDTIFVIRLVALNIVFISLCLLVFLHIRRFMAFVYHVALDRVLSTANAERSKAFISQMIFYFIKKLKAAFTVERSNNRVQIISGMLNEMKGLMPPAKCSKHREAIDHAFDSFQKFVENNADHAWFLPAACNAQFHFDDHRKNFTALELREWSWFAAGNNGGLKGILDFTKYLFITWDLSRLDEWDDHLLAQLLELLSAIGRKTASGQLFVHRTIILDKADIGSNQSHMQKLQDIWGKCFKPYVNDHYRIKFIDSESTSKVLHEVGVSSDDFALFKDVVLHYVKDKRAILPSPEELSSKNEYAALQFSSKDQASPMLLLFAVQGTTAGLKGWGGGTELGDHDIAKRRQLTRKIVDVINSQPSLEIDMRSIVGDYRGFN